MKMVTGETPSSGTMGLPVRARRRIRFHVFDTHLRRRNGMSKFVLSVTLILLCTGISVAQHGTAEPGHYVSGFNGDTWTGEVTAVNEDSREFTLTYTKGSNTQTFVGVLPQSFTVEMKDGRDYRMKMTELMGMRLKAYYITKKKKDANGVKTETREVFKIKSLPKAK
jgi:hypothetical protein